MVDPIGPPQPVGIGFYKSLIALGATLTIVGLLLLLFQAGLYLAFGDIHVFSAFGFLQRLGWERLLATGVVGFDATVEWALALPLGVVLAMIGVMIGVLGGSALQQEKFWHKLK